MPTTPKHTPTPTKFKAFGVCLFGDGAAFATIHTGGSFDNKEADIENAKEIAKRLNAHAALVEALTEVFSAVSNAERAGCVVSGWDGAPVRFRPDIHGVYSLVCSATPGLHAEVLRALAAAPG